MNTATFAERFAEHDLDACASDVPEALATRLEKGR
mgnify:CR=1 FL=1